MKQAFLRVKFGALTSYEEQLSSFNVKRTIHPWTEDILQVNIMNTSPQEHYANKPIRLQPIILKRKLSLLAIILTASVV
jgi:hypothetical protein